MKRATIAVLLVLALGAAAAGPLAALDELEANLGLTLLGNTVEDGAPSPFMPTFGLNLPLGTPVDLEVGVLAWWTYYTYSDGRALPVEYEFRDFWVLGLLADARIGYTLRLGQGFAIGAHAGLALLLRVPFALFDDAAPQTGALAGYLYGKARFLYPVAELYGRFPLVEGIALRVSLRGYFPVFHLWDGESLPFADQLMLSGLVGIVFALPKRDQTKS